MMLPPNTDSSPGRGPAFFQVTRDLHGLRTWIVNLYFQGVPGSENGPWVLIDAGMPGATRRVLHAAETLFGTRPPEAIVLTHAHFDHIGALKAALRRWANVPVYAHTNELPFLRGEERYPPPDPTVGGAMARMSPLFPRRSVDVGLAARPLPADGSVPGMPDWRWVATPGHSAGHVSLFRETDRLLIAGDALVTVRQERFWAVATQRPGVRPPPAYFTVDWAQAHASMRRLAQLRPDTAATGHGRVLTGPGFRRQLDDLLNHFDERGLPKHGRYVAQTWPSIPASPAGGSPK